MKAPTSPCCVKPVVNQSLPSAGNSSPLQVRDFLCFLIDLTILLIAFLSSLHPSVFIAPSLTLFDPWWISRFTY